MVKTLQNLNITNCKSKEAKNEPLPVTNAIANAGMRDR
jgi:hypothetical protein